MSDSERLVRNIQQASLQVQQWPSWMRNLREGVSERGNRTASSEQQQSRQQEPQLENQERQKSAD